MEKLFTNTHTHTNSMQITTQQSEFKKVKQSQDNAKIS